MKKRKFGLVMSLLLAAGTMLAGCGGDDKGGDKDKKSDLKVGMVTDAGTIDDKSFNQGTWEGILKAEDEFGVNTKYLKP
ncbi:MAG: BMP family ABC transporter substrate-binding protein, partial [Mesobacillus sp.]|uniref:BMP family ABC transporter substrate-binding protein n=1 Tax=Mesobacillus sp. TaxID=2675271 RepID=UPI003C66E0EF